MPRRSCGTSTSRPRLRFIWTRSRRAYAMQLTLAQKRSLRSERRRQHENPRVPQHEPLLARQEENAMVRQPKRWCCRAGQTPPISDSRLVEVGQWRHILAGHRPFCPDKTRLVVKSLRFWRPAERDLPSEALKLPEKCGVTPAHTCAPPRRNSIYILAC